jgi:creatinine amidohydrolase
VTEIQWANLKAHELRRLAERDAIVVMPVAALEQHGPHLPVQVDSRLGYEVSCRAAQRVAKRDDIVVLPPVWHGMSEHHLPFGGTISLDYDTFFRVLRGITRCLVVQGFRRVCITNSHGGNVAGIKVAAADLTVEFGIPVIAVSYMVEAGAAYAKLLKRQKGVQHACEAETSMMMVLTPDLVDASALDTLAGPDTQGISEISANGAYRWYSFASRTHNGVIGDPALANREKGEKLLNAAAEALAKLLLNPNLWAPPEDLRVKATGGVALAGVVPLTPYRANGAAAEAKKIARKNGRGRAVRKLTRRAPAGARASRPAAASR